MELGAWFTEGVPGPGGGSAWSRRGCYCSRGCYWSGGAWSEGVSGPWGAWGANFVWLLEMSIEPLDKSMSLLIVGANFDKKLS